MWRLILCVTLALSSLTWFEAAEAEGRECSKGYVWVETTTTATKSVKASSSGKHARAIYTENQNVSPKRKGHCKRVGGSGQASGNSSTSHLGERFCRVDSEVEGISDAEMDSGYLVVNGNRWRKCPDGVEEIGDPTAESMTLDLDALARSLAVQLNLPDATPIFSPDPNNNEWKMLAVGFPIWLRTDGPDSKSTTASTQGLTFRLSATRTSTTFTMGDGKTITCTAMARYSDTVKAGSPSPNCGHTYQQPSGKNDRYTVTGTHHWTVTWSVDSFSGSFPMTYSDSSTIRIGELSALNR